MPRVGIDHAAASAAWASTRHARAYAADVAVKAFSAAGHRDQARRAWEEEREAVASIGASQEPASPWWYFYNEAFSLQTGALHALRFNDPVRAHQAVNESFHLIDSTNLHNVAFNLLYVSEAFLQQGEPQEASTALKDVAELACTKTSTRIRQRVMELRTDLSPWGNEDYVRELDEHLQRLS
jgi:hypothetical protein